MAVGNSSQAVKWMRSEMSAYRAESLLRFRDEKAQVLALALDGCRLGRPSKELLLGVLSAPALRTHMVMPPPVALEFMAIL